MSGGGRRGRVVTGGISVFIAGLQKLTLLDYPGQVACTVFTGGLRLPVPVLPQRLPGAAGGRPRGLEELGEVLAFLKKRVGVLDGRRRRDNRRRAADAHRHNGVFREKALGYSIKLDTNGTFPDRLREIVGAGLADRVAMDIKTAPEHYGKTVGIPDVDISKVARAQAISS